MTANEVSGRRWTKHGKDRLFVSFAERDMGWVDLKDGSLHPGEQVPVQVLAAAAARAAKNMGVPLPPYKFRGLPWPDASPVVKAHDLARNTAGKGVTSQARTERGGVTKAAMEWMGKNALQDAGVTRTDQAWDAGAKGERIVGKLLNAYCDASRGLWHVLHSVPVGGNGADIDHVLIGPAGVLTVNTKYHPRRTLTVTANGILLDGEPADYGAKSLAEAERASRLVSRALGWTVPTAPMLVLAQGTLNVSEPMKGVAVVTAESLHGWLNRSPVLLNAAQIGKVYSVARNRNTWKPKG